MKIGAAMKLVKTIAAKDPLGWAASLRCYVCQFCGALGGMNDAARTVNHHDGCIWAQARELVTSAT